MDDWFDVHGAADYTKVSASTLAKMRISRERKSRRDVTDCGPPFSKVGRRVIYSRVDLDRWLHERVVCPGDE